MSKAYTGWAIVEFMGHRRLAGEVSEVEQYGVTMLRLDVPGPNGATTQFYGGGAIYAVTPCSEETARKAATMSQPSPVYTWELPPASEAGSEPCDLEEEDSF